MKSMRLLMLAGAVLLLNSCIKYESVPFDQLDVTLTKYETGFDFGSYRTFTLSDSTVLKTNILEDDEINGFYKPGGVSEKILAALRGQFETLNYTYTDSKQNADFIVVPTVLMVRRTGTIYFPPGWWWRYPGWGWGWRGPWFPRYPWNPGFVRYYSFSEGALVLEMVDGDSYRKAVQWAANNPGDPTASDEIPDLLIRWMASIDGYLSSNAEYNAQRAQRGFKEAFDQSPYLSRN